jgi:HSP20 family protein
MASTLSKRVGQSLAPLFGRDPFASFEKEVSDLMSRFRTDWNSESEIAVKVPSMNLSETDKDIQASIEVPGFKPDEIQVEVCGNVLRISGQHKEEKKEDKEDQGKVYHCVERSFGSFSRAIPLPAPVLEDEVTADCNDGVLTITLPKKEVAKKQKITINSK